MINKELKMIDEERMDRVIQLLTLLDRKDIVSLNELMRDLKKFDNVTVKLECDEEDMLEAYEELRNERVELLKECENIEGRLKDKNNEISFLCEVIDALEEEKEELDDECYELEEENTSFMQEIKELKGENMRLKFNSIAEKMEDTYISNDLVKAGLKAFDSSWHSFGLSEDELKDVLTSMENSKSNYSSLLKEIDEACRVF